MAESWHPRPQRPPPRPQRPPTRLQRPPPHERPVGDGDGIKLSIKRFDDRSKRSNSTWAVVRATHKNARGEQRRPTYAEVVAE